MEPRKASGSNGSKAVAAPFGSLAAAMGRKLPRPSCGDMLKNAYA